MWGLKWLLQESRFIKLSSAQRVECMIQNLKWERVGLSALLNGNGLGFDFACFRAWFFLISCSDVMGLKFKVA